MTSVDSAENAFSDLLAVALADASEWQSNRASSPKKPAPFSIARQIGPRVLEIKEEDAPTHVVPYSLRQRPPKKISGIISQSLIVRVKRKAEDEPPKPPPAKRAKRTIKTEEKEAGQQDDPEAQTGSQNPAGEENPSLDSDDDSDDDDDDEDLGEEARAVREIHNMCRNNIKIVDPALAKARWDAATACFTKDEKLLLKFLAKKGKLETCIQQYAGIFETAKHMSEHTGEESNSLWMRKQVRKQHCGTKELDNLLDVVNRVIDEQIAKYFPSVPPRDAVVAAIRSNLPRGMSKRITAGWLTKFIRGDICSGLGQRDFTFRLSRRGRKQRPHNHSALEEAVLINIAVERAQTRSDKHRFPRISKETKATLLGAKNRIAVSTVKNNLRNLPSKLMQQARADANV